MVILLVNVTYEKGKKNLMKYLSTKVNHVGVSIVERKHDTIGSVQLDHDNRIIQRFRTPETVLALAHLVEPGGENQASLQENGPRGLGALVAVPLLVNLASSRVDDPDLLVLAGVQQFGPIVAPRGREDQVGGRDDRQLLAGSHVPDDDQVITSC